MTTYIQKKVLQSLRYESQVLATSQSSKKLFGRTPTAFMYITAKQTDRLKSR